MLVFAFCILNDTRAAEAQIGQPIVEIQLDQEGRVVNEPAVLRLLETHVGDRLSVKEVRETIAHLMALGRFEDVQVQSEPAGNGVRVKYLLLPRHPIDRIEFAGRVELSEDELRRLITDRFGSSPSTNRLNEVTETLRLEYRRRGYPSAKLTPRLDITHDPDRATLVIEVNPGPRARILDVRITQVDATERSTLTEVPDIKVGDIYDETEIGRKMQGGRRGSRARGYYEARANQNASISGDGSVFLFLNLELGPMVRLVFEGDPLPADEVDRLVPVRREASVDEDLLEDSQSTIESYLHAQGHRDAMAMYTREERAGELIITFRITRGPRYVMRSITLTGNFVLPTQQLLPLVRLKEEEPFVRSTLAMGVSAIENTYRVSGFTVPQLKATESVVAPEDPRDPDRLVNVTITIVEGPRTEVRSVTFQGNMALSDAELGMRMSTAPGRVYSIVDVVDRSRHDRAGVSRPRLRERGRHAADDVCRARHAGRRSLHVVEGPQIIVDHVIIAGNRRISTETIEREIMLRPGEPYGESAVVQSRINLNRLELFRRVQIECACAFRRDTSRRPGAGRRVPVDDSGPLGRRRGRILREADRRRRSGRGSVRSHAAWIDSGDAAQSVGQEPDDYAVHARQPAHQRHAAQASYS